MRPDELQSRPGPCAATPVPVGAEAGVEGATTMEIESALRATGAALPIALPAPAAAREGGEPVRGISSGQFPTAGKSLFRGCATRSASTRTSLISTAKSEARGESQ